MVNSVLIKNIKSLQSSLNENVSYVDLNFRGIVNQTTEITDDDGNKKEYVEQTVTVKDEACLRDQFRIWLMSASNDFHRNPDNGGFLEKHVVKRPFIDDNCPVIEALLKSEAESKFPNIKVMDVSVSCNHSTRQWMIKVSLLDKKTGLIDNTMYVNGEAVAVDTDS